MSASNNLNIINFKSPFRCILRCLSCCRFPFCRAQQYSYAVIATVQPNPTQPTAAVQLQYWTREGKNDIRDVGSTADLVPDCTWLYLSVPECTWLYLIVPDFTWFYLILPDCTWLGNSGNARIYVWMSSLSADSAECWQIFHFTLWGVRKLQFEKVRHLLRWSLRLISGNFPKMFAEKNLFYFGICYCISLTLHKISKN